MGPQGLRSTPDPARTDPRIKSSISPAAKWRDPRPEEAMRGIDVIVEEAGPQGEIAVVR
jgi:hypothetical protein